jgi:ABC-type amino acid transport system permease subunit
MPNSDLLPSLLYKLHENQLALEAAIMELTLWVEHRGSADVAENVRGALEAIDKNEEFIKMTLAVMMTPE